MAKSFGSEEVPLGNQQRTGSRAGGQTAEGVDPRLGQVAFGIGKNDGAFIKVHHTRAAIAAAQRGNALAVRVESGRDIF